MMLPMALPHFRRPSSRRISPDAYDASAPDERDAWRPGEYCRFEVFNAMPRSSCCECSYFKRVTASPLQAAGPADDVVNSRWR